MRTILFASFIGLFSYSVSAAEIKIQAQPAKKTEQTEPKKKEEMKLPKKREDKKETNKPANKNTK